MDVSQDLSHPLTIPVWQSSVVTLLWGLPPPSLPCSWAAGSERWGGGTQRGQEVSVGTKEPCRRDMWQDPGPPHGDNHLSVTAISCPAGAMPSGSRGSLPHALLVDRLPASNWYILVPQWGALPRRGAAGLEGNAPAMAQVCGTHGKAETPFAVLAPPRK